MDWQPIETAPKGRDILVAYADGKIEFVEWDDDFLEDRHWLSWESPQYKAVEPIYWFDLPDPPKATGGE